MNCREPRMGEGGGGLLKRGTIVERRGGEGVHQRELRQVDGKHGRGD